MGLKRLCRIIWQHKPHHVPLRHNKKHNKITQDTLNQLKNLSKVPGKWDIVDNQINITLKRNYEDRLVDKIYVACKKLNIDFDKCVCIHS